MLIPIKIKSNLTGFDGTLLEAVENQDPKSLSFGGALFNLLSNVRDHVLDRYDQTARKERRIDLLKKSIKPIWMIYSGFRISANMGDPNEMPFYWKFQEFGTKPYQFIQPFRVSFGETWRLKPIKKSAIGNITFSPSPGDSGFMVIGKRLIKFINVSHPGIRARGFFLSGSNFMSAKGQSMTNFYFGQLMNSLINRHVSLNRIK